jgi:phosphoribosylaminoimidazolecarboxamide formyltransferase / IMP cyclohydrolase
VASEDGAPVRVERALLSVDDKSGIADLARGLVDLRVELWATGGTRRAVSDAGVPVGAAEDLTGIAAWFGGRVKTLHPALLGGILAPRTDDGLHEMRERGLRPFDLVVVNLYPFERHLVEHPGAADREEYIDIGGVTLARAGAKNHAWVTVVTDPAEYPTLLAELRANGGAVSAATRSRLAVKAFERTAAYDAAIARALAPPAPESGPFPEELTFRREPLKLRYGENPHQRAAVYRMLTSGVAGAAPRPFTTVKGDALSFTNLLDVDTAVAIVAEFPGPTAAVVKHATPCGAASGTTVREALERAIATDPVARYGCAIAVNRPLGPDDPGALKGVFVDLLVAPAFDPAALERLGHRPKVKVVRADPPSLTEPGWEAKSALGRLLLQESDHRELVPEDFKCVTSHTASPEAACALDFAWRVVRHAKSNAIVLAQGARTVGIGSGQPTRVKAVELACEVAGDQARGAVLASDAFFPFPDGVEVAGRAGVAAIIQPGGSLRDPEVIAAAERFGIAMYFTGWRVFRH